MFTSYFKLENPLYNYFDCTVGTGGDYPSLKAAIEDGKKRILVISNITENQPININHVNVVIVVGNNKNSITFGSFLNSYAEKEIHFYNLNLFFNNLTIPDYGFKLFISNCVINLNNTSILARQSFIVNSKINSNNTFNMGIYGTIIASAINGSGYFGNVVNSGIDGSDFYFGNINGSYIYTNIIRLGRVYAGNRNAECKNNILFCSYLTFEYNVLFENNSVTIYNSISNFTSEKVIIRNNYFSISSTLLRFSNSGNYNDKFVESIIENNTFHFLNGGTLEIINNIRNLVFKNNIINGDLKLQLLDSQIENNKISGIIKDSNLENCIFVNNIISSNLNSFFTNLIRSNCTNNSFYQLNITNVISSTLYSNTFSLLYINHIERSFVKNNEIKQRLILDNVQKSFITENIIKQLTLDYVDNDSIINDNINP